MGRKKQLKETKTQREKRIHLENKRIIKSYKKNKKKRKIRPVIKLSNLDTTRIARLLFMGIELRVKIKSKYRYKVWVKGFPHLFTVARTACSAYRRMFRLLKSMGVYFP